jgi:hypothetical protein
MQAQILIQIEDSGKFNFVGPLDNKILCYGLLQLALEAVSKHVPAEQSAQTPPPAEEPAQFPALVAQ